MNKIGFNVLAWSAGMSSELFPIIERLKTIGYDGVELFVGSPDEAAYKEVGRFCSNIGLDLLPLRSLAQKQIPSMNPPVFGQKV